MIAATNRDLPKAVKAGTFREDLFFRLNVIPITLPPLRERRRDIGRLAEFIVTRLSAELKRPELSLGAGALKVLEEHDWPGNVRELENVLERAAVLSSGAETQAEELALPVPPVSVHSPSSPYQAQLDAAEKALLVQALRDHGGDKKVAARAMGVALSTFYGRLKRHQIS